MSIANELVIADSGVIFSLSVLNKLEILEKLFDEIKIPIAVWNEITLNENVEYYDKITSFFTTKKQAITWANELKFVMDYGESEAITLYKEINADFLLIDDRKARLIAESMEVNCIGTIGLLISAKQENFITKLRPLFEILLANKRHYSLQLLNSVLRSENENLL